MQSIRKKRKWLLLTAILLICGAYQVWRMCGRGGYNGPPQLNLKQTFEFGKDVGVGNIVAIQPWMIRLMELY